MTAKFDKEQGGAGCPIFPKQGPRAVVLCNGPQPPDPLLRYWLQGAEFFVCADAAGHPYDHLPLVPEVVIGDFDSLAGRILDGRGGPRLLRVDDQHTTDSEKALLFLEKEGVEEVVMMGAVGWRLDHTLYNTQLLERFAGRLRICLSCFRADAVRIGPGEDAAWELPSGTRFSILPVFGPAAGVTLEGALYPLLGDDLRPGGPATISNRVTMSPLLIAVREGSLLVTVDRPESLQFFDDLYEDE